MSDDRPDIIRNADPVTSADESPAWLQDRLTWFLKFPLR